MKAIAYLLLTVLATTGPAFVAAPVAAGGIEPVAIAAPATGAGAIFVSGSGHVGDHRSLHGNHHFRQDDSRHRHFSGHDRHFREHNRHFFRDHRRFDLHEHRGFGIHDHRRFLDHDRHFFGDRHGFVPDRHPHLKGYVPRNSITVCYRSGSVLVCYGG